MLLSLLNCVLITVAHFYILFVYGCVLKVSALVCATFTNLVSISHQVIHNLDGSIEKYWSKKRGMRHACIQSDVATLRTSIGVLS